MKLLEKEKQVFATNLGLKPIRFGFGPFYEPEPNFTIFQNFEINVLLLRFGPNLRN